MSLQPETIIYMGKAVPSSGSGAHTETALLSITTAPAAPFAKGSKYFRNEDGVAPELNKKIYTAVADGTWEGAELSEPVFGAYYTYNGDTYTWDGNSLQIFELEDYQLIADKTDDIETNKTSSDKYPSTKGVHDYFVAQGTARNFTEAGITKITSSYTFLELAEEIRGKQFATGTTLYGEVRNQGMPAGIGNAEVRVEVLETKSTVNPSGSNLKSQVIEFTLFSTDIEPKEWTFIYYDQRNTQWVWVPKDHIVIVDDITMFQLPNAPLGSELPLPVLDDITIPGEYTIRFDLSTMAPGALLIGNLIVSNAGLLSQKYTCEISGATFILTRQQESNTWTPWFCISGLNNFFTPANLVAGTNLQITRAADESGYDKYTVGTTDKVYTQDNLIAGNNIEFYNVGQINISSSDIIGTQTISSDGKFISTSNSYIRLSSTSMPGYSGQIFMSGAPWEYIIKFKTPNDFSKKARITHFGTLRQYPAIACGIIGENDIGGQTTSDDIRKIAFAVNTSQDWKGEYSEYKVLANTWYKIKIYRDQQNHAYKVDLFDNGSWINIISISGDPYTRWSAPDYIFIGSADTAEIGENIPLEYDFKDLSFNSSSLTTNPWVAITEGSETQINAPTMTGATSLANGTSGTVPAPTIADKDKYLKGDGTWSTTVPTLTWYTNNTTASITIVDTSTARLVKVYYNGVLLQPTEDYTINGTTLTFIGNVLAASDKVAVEVFN